MIKKIIALIFVSFFVMSGLTVLNENNQNYNISSNNINSFVDSSSFSPLNYTFTRTISFSTGQSAEQIFGCYNKNFFYIYDDYIMDFNAINDSVSTFLSLSSQPNQIEIYNNFMIISFGGTLFDIYNFLNDKLYSYTLSSSYTGLQFVINNNIMYVAILQFGNPTGYIYIYNITLSSNVITLDKSFSIGDYVNQFAFAEFNNNIVYALNTGGGTYTLSQLGFLNINSQTLNLSSSSSNSFGNINSFIDLGNYGILGSESYFFNTNSVATTQYSYNAYSSGLYFMDSNYNNSYLPFYPSNFTKLPLYATNYQEFITGNTIKYIYLPLGQGNSVFNTASYIINGNNNLYIVSGGNIYVYELNPPHYILTVKSYNSFSSQINNYLLFNGQLITSSILINKTYPCVPTITPLNYSTYYYNGSKIIITSSDYTGSFNKYYNLSIYYNQVQAPSIPLYDIFTYMYPISIIGLFVGMGAFVFTIKKRGYKI